MTETLPLPPPDALQRLGLCEADFDAYHHLRDVQRWSPAVMEALAKSADVPLTDELIWLVNWVRGYHLEYGNPPLMRTLVQALREEHDNPNLGSRKIYAIHATHPVRMACWLGGLPRPDWCI